MNLLSFHLSPKQKKESSFSNLVFKIVWALRAAFDRDDIWQHWWKLNVLPQLLMTQNDVCEYCSRSVEL
jgi:hypothetical protein